VHFFALYSKPPCNADPRIYHTVLRTPVHERSRHRQLYYSMAKRSQRASLGSDDELFITPTRTIVYRADGLLSDESADEYPTTPTD